MDRFGYLLYENNSKGTRLQSQVILKEAKGVKLRKPYRGESFKVSVGPGEKQIVMVAVDFGGQSTKIKETGIMIG